MVRVPVSGVILWAVLALSCGKDYEKNHGGSPTEPAPSTPAAALPGTWRGTMTLSLTGQPRVTCALEVALDDDGDPQAFTGTWSLQCPDGSHGNQLAVALLLPPLGVVSLTAFPSPDVLDGCPWGGLYPRQGNRLTGDWVKGSNATGACQASPIQGGTVDLTKVQ